MLGSDAATPIRNARVSVSPPSDAIDPVFTDGSGRFEFTRLAAGRYTLVAEKTGFVRTLYGSKNDLDPPIPVDVGAGAAVDGIDIRMPRGAAIQGRVVDELGEPVVGASVSAGFLRSAGGDTRFVGLSRPGSETDDRGEYRIAGLSAGRYYVSVAGSSEGSFISGAPQEWARTISWSRTFYFASPGIAGASPIVLGTGEERAGVDLVLVPSRPAKLTLSLTDAAGAPATGLINLFLPGDTPGSIVANRGVPLSPANPKMTSTLESGEWVAVALGNARSMARVKLSSGDDMSLTLALGAGARIAGRVAFEGSSAPPPPGGVRLGVRGVGPDTAVPAPGLSGGPVALKSDGSFEVNGVVGTIELQAAAPLRGWVLRSVTYGDRDLLEEPLTLSGGEEITGVQVVFTDRLADVAGSVVDGEERPSPGCTVAVFPADGRGRFGSRRTRLVRADQNGRFNASDLPSGSYLTAATPDVDAAVWLTADYLNRLQTISSPLTLTDRERKTITLRCASLP
jgi:carboxypeptidase family protein